MKIYQVHDIVIMVIIIVIMHDYIYSLLFHHYCDYNVELRTNFSENSSGVNYYSKFI